MQSGKKKPEQEKDFSFRGAQEWTLKIASRQFQVNPDSWKFEYPCATGNSFMSGRILVT